MRHVVVLANGDWGNSNACQERLRNIIAMADCVIAADGALDRASARGIPVDVIIGDLDSVADPLGLQARYPRAQILAHPEAKDFTDLELALEWAIDRSPERVVLFGATGGRIDHTMANLAFLERGLHSGVCVELISGNEIVRLVQDDLVLNEANVGDRISLLPISLFVTVSTQGLQYGLSGEKLFRGWGRGISNVVSKKPVRIEVETGVLAVIHAANPEG